MANDDQPSELPHDDEPEVELLFDPRDHDALEQLVRTTEPGTLTKEQSHVLRAAIMAAFEDVEAVAERFVELSNKVPAGWDGVDDEVLLRNVLPTISLCDRFAGALDWLTTRLSQLLPTIEHDGGQAIIDAILEVMGNTALAFDGMPRAEQALAAWTRYANAYRLDLHTWELGFEVGALYEGTGPEQGEDPGHWVIIARGRELVGTMIDGCARAATAVPGRVKHLELPELVYDDEGALIERADYFTPPATN